MHPVLLLCLLTTGDTWKKDVLRSPKVAAFSLDLSAENSSSRSKIIKYSSMICFSSWSRNSLGLLARAFWAPFNLAKTLLFLAKIFPKNSKFHFLALLVKPKMAKDGGHPPSQASFTILGNFGRRMHMIWKWKSLFLQFQQVPSNSINTR